MSLRRGWKWAVDDQSGNGTGALQLFVDSENPLYVYDRNGRMSTLRGAGSALNFPDNYNRGEAWELRFRTQDTNNGQFQGIFLQVRTDVANSSTIRGMEVEARQGANTIAIGELIGGTFLSRGAGTTGAITTMIGMDAQVQMDSDSTYTITNCFGIRVKMQLEDGATVTTGYGIKIEVENVTGAPTGGARLDAFLGVSATSATQGVFQYGIDTSATEFTNSGSNEIVLWKFQDSGGTTRYIVYDTGNATVVAVANSDPTS